MIEQRKSKMNRIKTAKRRYQKQYHNRCHYRTHSYLECTKAASLQSESLAPQLQGEAKNFIYSASKYIGAIVVDEMG